MKHLRKYESFSEEALYEKWREFIDSLIEIFEEFEDDGWYWSSGYKHGRNRSISLDWWPEFNCIMLKDEDDYIPAKKDYKIDYTGHFKSGEIIWDTKDFEYLKSDNEIDKIKEESENFIVAIKRLNDATNVDFSFSYNSKGGELKMVIRGFVKIKI